MSLTRKMLKAMGIEDEKIEQIIEAHTDTVDALKEERDKYKVDAEKLPEVQGQLDSLKKSVNEPNEFKDKFEKEHEEFENYKAEVAKERALKEKTDLYRGLLKSAGVDEKRIDSIIKVTDMDNVTVKDGKIDGSDKLIEDIKSNWSDFIVNSKITGAGVDNPPSNGNDPDYDSMSDAEYYKSTYEAKKKA